ncbi:TetR/AcrR family transcriptional regulator [Anianabacter salinae]|uniref:TetR/AcrR family transcriptional regulator n=1 Tax=Anianabacter salinae TaxID=2851023 RepID=UPI00225E4951|nr:TetR/AcrR family transcriptional regulator [Anianabacter salinae]MBV0913721.1 TetR/AcrR family transcriptional regulator [Anianabacter salinae]
MNADPPRITKGRKFEQVLDGARDVFLRDGYEGASVDTIAKAAGVSKATLYSYFPDKASLFVETAVREMRRVAEAAMATIDPNGAVEACLHTAASHMVRFLLSGFGQRIHRICVAETDRFPEIGRNFYLNGPMQVREELVSMLACATRRGELVIEDLDLAADQFAELCKADLFPRMVFGIQSEFTDAEIDRVVDGAVATFLARYRA